VRDFVISQYYYSKLLVRAALQRNQSGLKHGVVEVRKIKYFEKLRLTTTNNQYHIIDIKTTTKEN